MTPACLDYALRIAGRHFKDSKVLAAVSARMSRRGGNWRAHPVSKELAADSALVECNGDLMAAFGLGGKSAS